MESLYEAWAKRNPSWEKRYQSTVVDVFCDYGKGVSSFLEARGKIFGALHYRLLYRIISQ